MRGVLEQFLQRFQRLESDFGEPFFLLLVLDALVELLASIFIPGVDALAESQEIVVEFERLSRGVKIDSTDDLSFEEAREQRFDSVVSKPASGGEVRDQRTDLEPEQVTGRSDVDLAATFAADLGCDVEGEFDFARMIALIDDFVEFLALEVFGGKRVCEALSGFGSQREVHGSTVQAHGLAEVGEDLPLEAFGLDSRERPVFGEVDDVHLASPGNIAIRLNRPVELDVGSLCEGNRLDDLLVEKVLVERPLQERFRLIFPSGTGEGEALAFPKRADEPPAESAELAARLLGHADVL